MLHKESDIITARKAKLIEKRAYTQYHRVARAQRQVFNPSCVRSESETGYPSVLEERRENSCPIPEKAYCSNFQGSAPTEANVVNGIHLFFCVLMETKLSNNEGTNEIGLRE